MTDDLDDLVLLHGFAGTARAWDGVIAHLQSGRYRPVALDLPGHGSLAGAAQPFSFAGCAHEVLLRGPARFALGGYSLGGRIALHVALAAPERVSRLILISTSAGIDLESERADRIAADEKLATDLEARPFEEFIERWRSQPLFADQAPHVRAQAAADHRRNRPEALAAVLRDIGAGRMVPLWDRLGELRMPVAVVVGERDAKYVRLGERLAAMLPRAELSVLPGGHGLPLECPAALAAAIEGAHAGSARR